MTNVVDQAAWWNSLLTSAIFTWLGETATNLYNKLLALKALSFAELIFTEFMFWAVLRNLLANLKTFRHQLFSRITNEV